MKKFADKSMLDPADKPRDVGTHEHWQNKGDYDLRDAKSTSSRGLSAGSSNDASNIYNKNVYTADDFIDFIIQVGALKFGSFTLKSGRISPYFFNAGLFYDGDSLKKLGLFYANTLIKNKISFQHLFGPAYKGLPLATTTAIALAESGINCTVSFNRKETKDHGEGGLLIGSALSGDTVIIDDVITAGTAFREAQSFIKKQGGNLTTVIIALDRCERGQTFKSTLAEIEAEGIRVLSIINLHNLIAYLEPRDSKKADLMKAYQESYGL